MIDNAKLSFKKLIDLFTPEVENFDRSLVELKLWRRKSNKINLPKTGLQILIECDSNIYPNIYFIFKIFSTLSVSTTTPEQYILKIKKFETILKKYTLLLLLLIQLYYI